nr:hypothetical protein [Tanacetum cinerariifolium]GEV94048.1 hypothetical protein [Tanacetum cinerariifolium]
MPLQPPHPENNHQHHPHRNHLHPAAATATRSTTINTTTPTSPPCHNTSKGAFGVYNTTRAHHTTPPSSSPIYTTSDPSSSTPPSPSLSHRLHQRHRNHHTTRTTINITPTETTSIQPLPPPLDPSPSTPPLPPLHHVTTPVKQLPVIDQTPLEESLKTLRIAFQAWSENIQQKKEEEEKQIAKEQAAKARYWKIPICYDDDEDYTIAIIPREPDNSLSMGDEHLDTILAMESDEFIKSSVENLVPNPSKSKGEHECDVPACDNFTTFSNLLFHANDNFSSSNNESFYDEDIPKEVYSNPLFDEEIISMKIDLHRFNVESDLIESLLNHDSLIISSSLKIDSLLDEFVGELTLLKSIPLGINETDCDLGEEICLIKKLFDSFMEEIDLSFISNDPMPPGIEEDEYDSKRDILILEELLSNDSLSIPKNESFHFDIPSSSRPPAKPPDGNSEILNIKVMGDISEPNVPMPKLMLTLVINQEKSPNLLSHQGHKASQPSTKCPMMIYRRNTHILDVPFLYFYPL